jgi:hypothetical protein
MQFDSGTLAVVLALLSLGGAIVCIIALFSTRRSLAEQQQEQGRQFAELNEKLSRLAPAGKGGAQIIASISASAEPADANGDELMAAVTAVAAAIADRKARVQSIREVYAEPDAGSAWSQQGRVVVQSSHNLSPRR